MASNHLEQLVAEWYEYRGYFVRYGSTKNHTEIGGAKILLIRDLVKNIFLSMKDARIATRAVPEQFPLLRTLQFAVEHRDAMV